MKKRRRLPLFAALVTLAAIVAALVASNALADGTLQWDGQGFNAATGELNSTQCGDSATGLPAGVDPNNYLQWNFTGAQDVTAATLTVNGDEYDYPGPFATKTGGTIKFFTPFYDLEGLVAEVDFTGTIGNAQLTISHGCGGKFEPELTTEASADGEGQAGDTLTDTAFLTGGSTNPVMGGTVDFALFNLDDDPTCEGTPIFTDTQNVVGEADGTAEVTSAGYTVLAAGTYSWVAEYSGDDNNEPAGPNDCAEDSETLTFAAAATTVVTELHYDAGHGVITIGDEIDLGSTVHDSATVSGPDTLDTPEGTVDFTFYTGGDCLTGTGESAGQVTLVNGVADPSDAFGPLVPAQYAFIAHYNSSNTDIWTDGDSTCEPFSVAKGQLTAATKLHDPDHAVIPDGSELDLGSVVHDTAQITGQVDGFDATGAVTFEFFTEEDCGGDPVDFDNVGDDEDSGDPRSEATDPLAPGSYGFKATVAGDDNYEGDTSDCEPFTVKKGQLNAATKLHDPDHNVIADGSELPLGAKVHDTAQITGAVQGFTPTGAVTFTWYPSYEACNTGGEAAANDGTESGSGDPKSIEKGPLTPGSYAFQATVAGDTNYEGDTSDCEPFTVKKGDLDIVTYIHNEAHSVVTFVPNNSTVHDTADISGGVTGFAPDLSKLSFTFYNTLDCTGTGADAGNNGGALDSSSGDPRSDNQGPLSSGAYSFIATFAGDTNYNPVTAEDVDCEPLSVRTFGKTMGYWGNKNGQKRLVDNDAFSAANAVTLGDSSLGNTRCWVKVDSQQKSKTILPNTTDGASLIPQCNATAKRDDGINSNSFNVLLAQTLALSYNIKYVSGFAGQPIISMGCTPVGTLTNASDVEAALDYANYLIGNAIKNNGSDVITQAQIGAMNTLLGCMNAEA